MNSLNRVNLQGFKQAKMSCKWSASRNRQYCKLGRRPSHRKVPWLVCRKWGWWHLPTCCRDCRLHSEELCTKGLRVLLNARLRSHRKKHYSMLLQYYQWSSMHCESMCTQPVFSWSRSWRPHLGDQISKKANSWSIVMQRNRPEVRAVRRLQMQVVPLPHVKESDWSLEFRWRWPI